MKKICILIGFIFLSLSVFSQGRNKLSISVTPLSTFKYDYDVLPVVKQSNGYKEKQAFGIGAAYAFHLGYGLHAGLGVGYSHYKIEGTGILPLATSTTPAKLSQTINYISVPLDIKYVFMEYFYVNAGIDFNFNISEINNAYFDRDDNIFGLHAGIGAQYMFSKDYRVFVSPYFQTLDKMDFYAFGLKMGIEYRF